MLPQTVVHWQSSVGVGDKFGAEQLDPDPKFDPKNLFLLFFKFIILQVLLLDFKCSTVCRANRIYRIFRQHNTVFLKAQKV